MKHHKNDHDERLGIRTEYLKIDSDRERLTLFGLVRQNVHFAGTGGVSKNNRHAGFLPAYQDTATGRVVLSCFGDGRPAPIHVLDGMPEEWVERRSPKGRVLRVKETVIAGFVRDGHFYTREDAVEASHH